MTAPIKMPVAVRAGCLVKKRNHRPQTRRLCRTRLQASHLSSSGEPFCSEANSGARSGWSVPTVPSERLNTRLRETPCLSVKCWRCVTNPRKSQAPPRPLKIRRGCRTMRSSCSTLMDGLSAGIPEQSAFTGIRVRRSRLDCRTFVSRYASHFAQYTTWRKSRGYCL